MSLSSPSTERSAIDSGLSCASPIRSRRDPILLCAGSTAARRERCARLCFPRFDGRRLDPLGTLIDQNMSSDILARSACSKTILAFYRDMLGRFGDVAFYLI